jgi:hypothetical protein
LPGSAHGIHLPRDDLEFNSWALGLIVVYVVVSSLVYWARGGRHFATHIPSLAFDSVLFAGSILLLIGIAIDRTVLRLLGDTTWFLLTAGTVGVIYALHAIFHRR